MFLRTQKVITEHKRISKNGLEHSYHREKTAAIFRCDNCDNIFQRDIRKMNRKRLNNNYFHCCSDCDSKRFAQRKGVEQKKIWDMPASVELPVSKF